MKLLSLLFILCYVSISQASWSIVIPAKANPETINAANELKIHLDKALSQKIPVIREGKKVSGKTIYLGNTVYARKTGTNFSKFPAERSLIQRCGNNIIIGGGHPRGVLYGVYEFLERFSGVTWLDPYVTINPPLKELYVPENTKIETQPSFRYRGVFTMTLSTRSKRNFYRNLHWRSRMRENIFWNEKFTPAEKAKWGITPVLGRPAPLNTLYYYTREWPEKGFEDALSLNKKGERVRATSVFGPGHICFSSLKARKTFAKQMLGYIKKDRAEFRGNPPTLYNLSINDTPNDYCVCKGCLALEKKYKAYSGAMLEFINYVAKEVGRHYPDVMIQTSAYFFVEKPPVGIKPAPNVTVRFSPLVSKLMLPLDHNLNKIPMSNLKKWQKIGKVQIWNYWINYVTDFTNAGIINVDTIHRNIQIFKKHGADYVFSECEKNDLTTFHPLRMYVGLQMKRDCTQKLDILLDRFFKGYYGKAEKPMRRLYEYIKLRQEEDPDRDHNKGFFKFHDGDFFRFAERCFNEADKLAGKDKELLDRIAIEKVPVDLIRLAMREKFKDTSDLPSRKTTHARLAVNWQKSIDRWWNDVGGRPTTEKNSMLIRLDPAEFKVDFPLPPKLKNVKCLTLIAKSLQKSVY